MYQKRKTIISLSLHICQKSFVAVVNKKISHSSQIQKIMAYRRRHGISRASTFKEEVNHPPDDKTSSPSPSSSLAAQAIRASAAHRDPSLYGENAFHSSFKYRSKVLFNILSVPFCIYVFGNWFVCFTINNPEFIV